LAASQLELTATLVVSGAIRDAILAMYTDPKNSSDQRVRYAYQISRLLRNAFAHSFVRPRWSIDKDCRDQKFTLERVIELDTSGLNGKTVEWRHYGGPLAIFAFCRFVRTALLSNPIDPGRELPPFPSVECYRQGRLILRRVEALSDGGVEAARLGPGEKIDLGNGYHLEVLPRQSD